VQREEFKRLGVDRRLGSSLHDDELPAEAQIAREIMKFAANGTLYRGSKPVMWSVVEKTALAEAEVEYEDYTSDTVWVKFPVGGALASLLGFVDLDDDAVDHARQPRRQLLVEDRYGLYKVTDAPPTTGRRPATADPRRQARRSSVEAARVESLRKRRRRDRRQLTRSSARHPLAGRRRLRVRRAAARRRPRHRRHGTGFVHTAPGHGREDFEIWMANARENSNRARHRHASPSPSMPTAR
jgi:isoleucyl-tRNA synthetase